MFDLTMCQARLGSGIWNVLQFIFGDAIVFSGAYHGVVAFIVVVIAILAAEYILTRIYKALA